MLTNELREKLEGVCIVVMALNISDDNTYIRPILSRFGESFRPYVEYLIDQGYETSGEIEGAVDGILGHQPLHTIGTIDEALAWWHFLRDLKEGDLSERYLLNGWAFYSDNRAME